MRLIKDFEKNLDKYIKEEKLELLGNPLPKAPEQDLRLGLPTLWILNLNLGLAPKFEVKLRSFKKSRTL